MTLNSAKRVWANGLKGLLPEQIKQGLDQCMASEKGYPPTLPVFIKYCKPSLKIASHKIYVPLPKPKKASVQVKNAALKEIRLALLL